MDIGKRLKFFREQRNISVYRLSKLSDISENYIHALEKNENKISVLVLENLLEHLGVTLPEFFNDNQDIIYATKLEKQHISDLRTLDEERLNAILHITKLMSNGK